MSYSIKNGHYLNKEECLTFYNEADKIIKKYTLGNGYPIEIEISNRLKRSAGMATISSMSNTGKITKVHIGISKAYLDKFGFNRIIGTLRHELAHVIGFEKTGKSDHSYTFKKICTELGGTMSPELAGTTFATSACEQYIHGSIRAFEYRYTCTCGVVVKRSKKMADRIRNSSTHRCVTCRTPLFKWSEEKVFNN